MNAVNWQANTSSFTEQSLVELQRLWVGNKWDLQVLCNQIEDDHSQQSHYKISINGPKGCGKSHLLQLLIKHLADSHCSKNTQADDALKLVFINPDGAQINCTFDLLNAIYQQCCDSTTTPISPLDTQKIEANLPALGQAIIAQLNHGPIVVFIEQFEDVLAAIGPQAKSVLQRLFNAQNTHNNPLSLIVTETNPSDVLPFTYVQLAALTQAQTQQLTELLLTKKVTSDAAEKAPTKTPAKAELNLCAQMLYRLFAGNGHYYQQFINIIGAPQLNILSAQLNHFIGQQLALVNATIAKLAPQQRQIISLLSQQVLQQSGAVPVSYIANTLRLTHQTTSSQLKKLRDKSLLSSSKVGRGSFYQLADITQSFSLAHNHLHPLDNKTNGINLSIDFALQWLKSEGLDLPSDDQQHFIVDKKWLNEHLVAPMLPLIIRLKHHIDSYLEALNNQQTEAVERFTLLEQKLTALSDNITNSPFAEQQHISAISHIELLNGLITRALICALNQPTNDSAKSHAFALSDHLFDFTNNLKLTEVWKHLGQLWVNTSALMAYSNDIHKLGHYISELEQQESKLRSLDNSINIAHCLVYKSWGYAQQDDKQKLQQTLEQLRIRSDKRNSPQLTGAYCHAVKLNISYLAEQDLKLAQRLVKQMLELSHRYPITDLYFACLWRLNVFEQEQSNFESVIKLIDKVSESNIFNAEICQLFGHIHQPLQLQALKKQLDEQLDDRQNLSIFSAALIKTACHTLVFEPQSFVHRANLWQQAIMPSQDEKESKKGNEVLAHTQKILLVLTEYHQKPDVQQLLQLPQLERQLIERKLIEKQLIEQQ